MGMYYQEEWVETWQSILLQFNAGFFIHREEINLHWHMAICWSLAIHTGRRGNCFWPHAFFCRCPNACVKGFSTSSCESQGTFHISAQYCKETAFQLSIPRKLCGILRYTVKLHLKLWLSSVCEWNNSWNPPMPFQKRGNLSMVFKTTWGHRFMTRGERFRDLKGPFWPVWSVWWKQRCWHHFRCVWMNTEMPDM